ncbi:hypothetical protein TB2_028475 [Malus domestica]
MYHPSNGNIQQTHARLQNERQRGTIRLNTKALQLVKKQTRLNGVVAFGEGFQTVESTETFQKVVEFNGFSSLRKRRPLGFTFKGKMGT